LLAAPKYALSNVSALTGSDAELPRPGWLELLVDVDMLAGEDSVLNDEKAEELIARVE
jgi:hypothetical protein